MTKAVARDLCCFVSAPQTPLIPRADEKHPLRMPAHTVGYIVGEEYGAWGIYCLYSKCTLSLGKMLLLSSRLHVANTTWAN
jgi:hypothetical protein